MSFIAQKLSDERLEDFVQAKEAAKDVGVNVQTLKRWLKKSVVNGVKWGRDRRKWVYVHRDSVALLKKYSRSIRVQ